ncbi:MAG: alginate export family protein [Acidobacteriota bacterium]
MNRQSGKFAWHWSLAVVLFFAGTGLVWSASTPAERGGKEPQESEETAGNAAVKHPPFQNVRYAEDWSVLRREGDRTPYEGWKFVPLDEKGAVYLSLGGQWRLRGEAWSNFTGLEDQDDAFGLSRLRIHGDLHVGNRFRLFVEGKSALATDRSLPGGRRTLDVDSLDLLNAFGELRGSWSGGKWSVSAGRRELQWGRQRLVSPLDWSNSRRTFDVVQGSVTWSDFQVEIFWSKPVVVRKYSFNRFYAGDADFYGAALTRRKGSLAWDLYWMNLQRGSARFAGKTAGENRHTVGGRVQVTPVESSLDWELEAAYQLGSFGGEAIRAGMVTTQVGYRWRELRGAPRVYFNVDFASGDGDPKDGKLRTFNQLFPLGHAYLGYMDLVGRQNIVDTAVGAMWTPWRRTRFTADLHNFRRATRADGWYHAGGLELRPAAAGSLCLGRELDLTARHSFNRFVLAELGYGHFFPGPFMRQTGPAEAIDWVYLTLQTTF